MARAAAVLPAPRSPDSVMTSPAPVSSARSAIRCAVAVSFGSASENVAGAVIPRRDAGRIGRAGIRRSRSCPWRHRDRSVPRRRAVRQMSAPATGRGPAPRCREPLDVALEPVEHLVLGLGRNAGAGIRDLEHDMGVGAPRADGDDRVVRREADGVGEQVIEHLHHARVQSPVKVPMSLDRCRPSA